MKRLKRISRSMDSLNYQHVYFNNKKDKNEDNGLVFEQVLNKAIKVLKNERVG